MDSDEYLPRNDTIMLKVPIPFIVHQDQDATIHVQENILAFQYDTFHFHPEIQISIILKGEGELILNEELSTPFQPRDVFIIASNISHVFKNSHSHYCQPAIKQSHIISIFFRPASFEKSIFQLKEFQHIAEFIKSLEAAIKIPHLDLAAIQEIIPSLRSKKSIIRFTGLIHFLDLIIDSPSREYFAKATQKWWDYKTHRYYNRIEPILEYVKNEFKRPMTLVEVSRLANMSVSSFSRYFKKYARRSFVAYLNEVRIKYACKLLKETDYSIYQICLEVGFHNTSNFNRYFKKITRFTPSEYRKILLSN